MAKTLHYRLSIEPAEGKSYLLQGTIGTVTGAQVAAETVYEALASVSKSPRSIAIMQGAGRTLKLIDCFNGMSWDSDAQNDWTD